MPPASSQSDSKSAWVMVSVVVERTIGAGRMPLEQAVSGMGVCGFTVPVPVLATALPDAVTEAMTGPALVDAGLVLTPVVLATDEPLVDAPDVAPEPPTPPLVGFVPVVLLVSSVASEESENVQLVAPKQRRPPSAALKSPVLASEEESSKLATLDS